MDCEFCRPFVNSPGIPNHICGEYVGHFDIGTQFVHRFIPVVCTRIEGHSGPHVHCRLPTHMNVFKITDDDYLTFPLTKGLYENR